MAEKRDLAGKVAIVTGAGSGIGLGCARYLAEAGAQVAIIDVNEAAGEAAREQIGTEAIFIHTDVSQVRTDRYSGQ